MNSAIGRRLDRMAIAISALCAIHCMVLPALVALPLLGWAATDDAWLHAVLLFVIVPVSLIALGMGYKRHADLTVVFVGLAGIIVLGLAAGLGHDRIDIATERIVTTAGGALLMVAHFLNMVRTRANVGRDNDRTIQS